MIECVQPVLMSKDLTKAIKFYCQIGFELQFSDSKDIPRYVGVVRDGIELHIQWHDEKEWQYPVDRPTYRFVVKDVQGLYEEFLSNGLVNIKPPQNTPWGTCEFHVKDVDGNGLQFYRDIVI